jgi:hypothetical protein
MPDTIQPAPTQTPVLEIDPTDVLTERVVNLLTPAFLAPAQGDEALARAAAFKALCDYYDHTPGDLLSVAQTILFGLATIEATGRSLAPGVSDTTFLRLSGRANALARSEARARKAMLEYSIPRPQPELPNWSAGPESQSPPEQAEAETSPQEAAPPPQPPAEVPTSIDHPSQQATPAARPASSMRAQTLGGVSHKAMVGAHTDDAACLPDPSVDAVWAALCKAGMDGAWGPVFTAPIAAE